MNPLERVLEHLVEAFASVPDDGNAKLGVTELLVDVPIESAFDAEGDVRISLPRGLRATGFMTPLGRLRVRCEKAAP